MAGNQLPVLTLDFSDEKIQRLNEIADKFKNALAIGPGGFPVPRPAPLPTNNNPSSDNTTGRERDEKGRFIASGKNLPSSGNKPSSDKGKGKKEVEGPLDKFLKSLNKDAQRTLKTFGLINKTLGATTNTLKGLFTTTISWGAKLAAISGGSMFGYGFMAHRATEQYKSSQALNITTGQMQAAQNVYGSRISGAGNIMQTLAAAQNDPSNPQYAGLMSLGINPRAGAAANMPKFLSAVASLLKQYKGTGVSQAVLRARGLDGVIDVGSANQILANSNRVSQLNSQFVTQSQRLEQSLGSGTQQSYQELSTRLSNNIDSVGNTFLKALTKLNGPIGKISDNLTASIEKFVNGGNGKAVFDTVANGLKKLGDWLGGDDFQTDLKTFADCVKTIISAIGQAIKWIAGNVPGVNLNGTGVGADGANPELVAFGKKYLGGHLPGANWFTNQYTGEYNKQDDVYTKYQMPNAMKSHTQKYVAAVNKNNNLPAGLMSAIAGKESSWNPFALNKKSGAAGLFQFMPDTAKAYGLEGTDAYDPYKASDAAGHYLNDLNKRYKGDVAKMLTSYNGGKIDEKGNLSLKKETVDYLLKILPQVQGAEDEHPGIIRQLRYADNLLAKGGKNDRATINLQVSEKPGSDFSAQVQGIYIPQR